MQIFATFIPGFSSDIETMLLKDYPKITILNHDESSILFEGDTDQSIFTKKYFTNVFVVLVYSSSSSQSRSTLTQFKHMIKRVSLTEWNSLFNLHQVDSFRIMVAKGSKLVHISKTYLKMFVQIISSNSTLTYSPLAADVEFWFIERSDNNLIIGLKLTVKKQKNRELHQKGKLRPHFAYLLAGLSNPQPTDIVLDPFAGYGSIVSERLSNWSYQEIIACDTNFQLVQSLQKQLKEYPNLSIRKDDALQLQTVDSHSITSIVTDPPWGLYDFHDINFNTFYQEMLYSFARVIVPNGICIILTSKEKELEHAINSKRTLWNEEKRISTLVNGKKAKVFCLRAIGSA